MRLTKLIRPSSLGSISSSFPRNRFACNASTFKMGEGGYLQINKTLNACAFEEYLSKQQVYLPKLEDIEQLSPRVIRVLGQNAGKVIDCPSIFKMKGLFALVRAK
jgi:hypothetical protein